MALPSKEIWRLIASKESGAERGHSYASFNCPIVD